jgi:hypothetical protein
MKSLASHVVDQNSDFSGGEESQRRSEKNGEVEERGGDMTAGRRGGLA